jgi:hypothetical protein
LLRVLAVCVLSAALMLAAGCTIEPSTDGEDQQSAASSRPSATPTPDTVERELGESATVTVAGEDSEQAELEVTVTDVATGDIKDLEEFRLDEETQASTPYYAEVRVTSTGSGDPTGRSVTLWGLDSGGTVRPPADVIGSFRTCQDDPLPKRFSGGDSARTCLLYLVPEGLTLDAVQYRFDDEPPFSWPVG